MYEGTTEYFANLFQVQQGLISEEEFYDKMLMKIDNSKFYDDNMSFTIMSKNILEEPYEGNYANVYEKGTLINMPLDLLLREKSNGEKGVLWLLKELSKKYGVNVPFDDDVLFKEIVEMTYPEVDVFFKNHVIGDTPIDYELYLKKVGLNILDVEQQTGYFFDGQVPYIDIDIENDSVVFIREGIKLNSFFNDLELKGGDVLKAINGEEITIETLRPIIGDSFSWTPEKVIEVIVLRNGEIVTVEGPVGSPFKVVKKITSEKDATEFEISLRNAWLKN